MHKLKLFRKPLRFAFCTTLIAAATSAFAIASACPAGTVERAGICVYVKGWKGTAPKQCTPGTPVRGDCVAYNAAILIPAQGKQPERLECQPGWVLTAPKSGICVPADMSELSDPNDPAETGN